MTTTNTWQEIVAGKKLKQVAAIPEDWKLKNLPSKAVLNVIDVPESCGLLTENEREITAVEVDVLLDKLATGVWSAVDVITAFAKRAVIAHQVVSVTKFLLIKEPNLSCCR